MADIIGMGFDKYVQDQVLKRPRKTKIWTDRSRCNKME